MFTGFVFIGANYRKIHPEICYLLYPKTLLSSLSIWWNIIQRCTYSSSEKIIRRRNYQRWILLRRKLSRENYTDTLFHGHIIRRIRPEIYYYTYPEKVIGRISYVYLEEYYPEIYYSSEKIIQRFYLYLEKIISTYQWKL